MDTFESMLKAVRDFLSFLEQNKQNILNISTPSMELNPLPRSGCISNFPSVKNDYFVQTPFILLPRLQENSNVICSGVDSCCNTLKSPRLALNSLNIQCSTSTELYSWCPVGPQVDGDCCLAGIERKPNQTSCRFVVTNRISSISEDGHTVYTDGGIMYHLRGGFTWSTFCALNPILSITSPPPGITDAFSNGFPAQNWRSWTQGLHYFLSTVSESIKEPTLIKPHIEPVNMMNSTPAKKLLKENPYKHILGSTNHNVDLDSLVVNTFRNLEKDLEVDAPVESKSAKTKRAVNKSPIKLNKNASSVASFSHFTSVSNSNNTPPISNRPEKSKKRKFPNEENDVSQTNHLTNKSIKHNKHVLSERRSSNKSKNSHHLHKVHRLSTLVSNHHSTLNGVRDDDSIDERYRLYTASGKVVDVRQLSRTRSGRIVLPKLDSRYEQSVVMNHEHVMGVSHNADDETLISWISELSSQ
ncbi:hypothetical protein MN116_005508 [Schistosoma mekongi]|uniref:Uncharacterized protein n=1 Tax=Schistosoma mekongi TaxID=38744 RepID=A0AAE1ZBG5_SCHME|nr:hypothetical protein MN116_005508 [Schistosoma mekongi]